MTITIRRTLHLDEEDFNRLDFRNDATTTMLKQKLILRATDNTEGESQIEKAFEWLKENCHNFYSVRGPVEDKGSIKYYIYFMNENEMTHFAMAFPRDDDD